MGNCNSCEVTPQVGSWYTLSSSVTIPPASCPSSYDAADYLSGRTFDRVIDGLDQTETLRIEGSGWDNTLIQNCNIHDVVDGDGILFLADGVSNVVIYNCTFRNIQGQAAIRGGVSGSSDNVLVLQNTIQNVAENGINFAQRSGCNTQGPSGLDHTNLQIVDNVIDNTGTSRSDGFTHGLYIQSTDFVLEGNTIGGRRDGNGISVRSSGKINCNQISGSAASGKPGIAYFSDHAKGSNNNLQITHNVLNGQGNEIKLFGPQPRYDGQCGIDHVVKDFTIQGNVFAGGVGDNDGTNIIQVDCQYEEDCDNAFDYTVFNNVIEA